MNQLLVRATLLIARLGQQPEGLSLRALAAATDIPPSTCVRVLRDLVALGWVDQHGPRGTYHLGPRATALSHEQPYRAALVTAAQPVVAQVARTAQAQVLVAVLRGDRRLVLLRSEAGAGDPLTLSEERELYASASGRLLIAHCTARARRRLVDALGLPPPRAWPGVLTWADLTSACADIRKTGCEINCPQDGPHNAVALAIPDGAGGTAALAIGIAKERWEEAAALRLVRRAAARIARGLAKCA